MKILARALLLAGLFGLLACSSDSTVLTQIVVVIDSELSVPSELDALRIDVTGATNMPHADADLTSDPLPRSLGLVHQGGPLGPIVVRVRGLLDSNVVVERSAQVAFVAGRSLELRITLERACLQMLSCGAGKTCIGGSCESSAIDTLPDWSGDAGSSSDDAGADSGMPQADAGGSDAGIDSGADTGTQNVAPSCVITGPADDSIVPVGSALKLQGSCTDPETGALTTGMAWSSNRDGALGMGETITRSNLSMGDHLIRFCGLDPSDSSLSDCDTITIHVVTLPAISASIDSVAQGVQTTPPFDTSAAIALSGSGTGYGSLTYRWTDSLAGVIGTGATTSMNPPIVGKHVVGFNVLDQANRSAVDMLSFSVLPVGQSTLLTAYDTANTTLTNNGSARIEALVFDGQSTLYLADPSKVVYSVPSDDASANVTLALDSPPSPDVVRDIVLDATNGLAYLATAAGYVVCDFAIATGIDGAQCATYTGGNLPDDKTNAVVRMTVGATDYLIVGTDKGLLRASMPDGSSNGVTKLSDISVIALAARGDTLWVATHGDGLFAYDPVTNQTLLNTTQDDGAPSDLLTSVAVGNGAIWVGSTNGIGRYQPSDDKWTVWRTGNPPAPGLVSNDVRDIAVTRPTIAGTARDVIWIATAAGVSRFDPSIPSFTTFTTDDGLPSNSVRELAVLPSGAIAIGTDGGLAIYAGP